MSQDDHLLVGDRPTDNDDELGRRRFAEVVARHLRRAPHDGGLVVSIVGPWGSGKTRVLQMVTEILEADDNFNGHVVTFNPWLFSGSDQLTAYFFLALADALPGRLQQRSAQLAEKLRGYGTALGAIRALPGVGGLIGATADVATEAARRIDPNAADLPRRREQVIDALSQMDGPIVVIIDDVDRLQLASEVRDLMRMVKLVGDLPGVTYVLAFDRRPIVAALGQGGISGQEYLEKIVQVEYRMPDPPATRLAKMLDAELSSATRELPDDLLDVRRWPEVYERIVKPLVKTPRHVRRVGNAVRLSVALHKADVDLVDQIALATLATITPSFHDKLLELADDLLPSVATWLIARDGDREQIKARLEKAADASSHRAVGEAVYSLLFPWTREVLTGDRSDELTRRDARRHRRVADPEAFWTYFNALLPDDAFSINQLRAVVTAMTNPNTLDHELENWTDEELPALVGRLRDFVDDVSPDVVSHAVRVLDKHAARRIVPRATLDDPWRQVPWLLSDLLERMPDNQRHAFLEAWAEEQQSASAMLRVFEVARHETARGEVLAGAGLDVLALRLSRLVRDADPEWLATDYWGGRMIWRTSNYLAEHAPEELREWLDASDVLFVRYLRVFTEPSVDDEAPVRLAWRDVTGQVGVEWAAERVRRISTNVAWQADDARVLEAARRIVEVSPHDQEHGGSPDHAG